MFKFRNGDVSRATGTARTGIRAEREWVPMGLPKFFKPGSELVILPGPLLTLHKEKWRRQ